VEGGLGANGRTGHGVREVAGCVPLGSDSGPSPNQRFAVAQVHLLFANPRCSTGSRYNMMDVHSFVFPVCSDDR
jgi:hypothetical protein